ncbi:MAG: hypothetical protein DME45_03795 [Verrucomicrobia bacterium]|nr:MAG: hypothetical protein DME45_03795 [Verrucomicrobiota bacterium]
MATYHINRSGTSLGTFSEEDVRTGLQSGRFLGTDLGWREGMATWQPLAQISEFAPDISAAGAAAPPPPQDASPGSIPPVTTAGARSGLPWDDRQEKGFFTAFIETLQMVLIRPAEAFTVMKREGGFGEPLIYAVVGGSVGAIVAFLFSLLFHSFGMFAGQRNPLGAMAGMGIGSIGFIVLVPLAIVIVLFIGAGIVHLCLMIVGGANQPFETTFRVLAFTQGSTGVLQLIPVCGGVIAAVWAIVVNCIGLARAHETDTGRAVLAVLLPLILCCGGAIVLVMMLGLGASALSHH